MNGFQRNGIVRLLANGQVDTTFAPGNGAQDPNSPNGTGAVRALAVQQDGKILIFGDFTFFNDVPRNHIARLNPDGSLDTSFNVVVGANGTVWSLTLVPDGLGGEQVAWSAFPPRP